MRNYSAASPSKRLAARASQAEAEAAAASSAATTADDDDNVVADYLAALSPGSPDKRERRGTGVYQLCFSVLLFLF